MKTLAEPVNEIKSADSSKSAKVEALVKLGLMRHEISIILKDCPTAVRTICTFGVEIECFIARANVASTFNSNNVNYQYESYNHTDNKKYYKFVTDGSVQGYDDAIECVSPVLKGATGMKSLKACCKSLNEGNAKVNKTCGLHIHVGGIKTEKQYVNVFKNYKMLESLIDTFMAESRRADNAYYCQSIKRFNYTNCESIRDVHNVMGTKRYFKVNHWAYSRHQTIEFRQHQGTTDFEKISNWANFCMKLVAWSLNNVLTDEVRDINDVPFLNANEKAFFKGRIEHFNA